MAQENLPSRRAAARPASGRPGHRAPFYFFEGRGGPGALPRPGAAARPGLPAYTGISSGPAGQHSPISPLSSRILASLVL